MGEHWLDYDFAPIWVTFVQNIFMLRATAKSSSSFFSISISPNFFSKELEEIMYDKNEGLVTYRKKEVSFDAISIDNIHFIFNREEANEV